MAAVPAGEPAAVMRGGSAPSPEAQVLVVDDVEANRELLRRRLLRLGIPQVLEAANGFEALEIVRARRLDLVLLDIMMPLMTGFEVLETLRAEGRLEGLPVIVISAANDMASTVRAIELGAEDFLMKPFDPTLLRARVMTTLEKKRLRDAMRDELARKQAELAEARALQMALAPRSETGETLNLDVVLEPAREIGGDLVDHLPLADGRHVLVLGDVSGKGAGAALMMARSHALVRGLRSRANAERLWAELPLAAAILNQELAGNNPTCMFMTLLLAVFDPSTGELEYVRCGHVPPFLLRAGGGVERLDGARGLPLGLMEGAEFPSARVQLAPGDRLLIVSDGVTEATAPDGALFDDARVVDWLADAPPGLAGLVERVRAFEDGEEAADDLSALCLTFKAFRRGGA